MAFQPAPACSIVVRYGLTVGPDAVNTFAVRLEGALDEPTAAAIAVITLGAMGNLNDYWATGVLGITATVTDLQEEDGAQYVYSAETSIDGNEGSNMLPHQTAALVSYTTARRGASFRGRNYFGGFTEANSNGRAPSSGLIVALGVVAADLLSAEADFGVISRYSGTDPETGKPIPRETALFTEYTGFTVSPIWRTQRRRAG